MRALCVYISVMLFSRIGNGVLLVANVYILSHLANSINVGGIALLIGAVPGLLLSGIIGLALRRSWAALFASASDAVKALIIIIYVFSVLRHSITGAFISCFLSACCTQAQLLSWRTWVGRSFEGSKRKTLNALSSLCVQGGLALGAAGGGLLLEYSSIYALAVVGVASALSATIGYRLYTTEKSGIPQGRLGRRDEERLPTSLAFFKRRAVLEPLMVCVVSTSSVLLMVSLLLSYVHNELKGDSRDFGMIDAAIAMGIALGAVSIARFPQVLGEVIDYRIGLILSGLGLMLLSFSHSLLFGCIAAFLVGSGTVSYTLSLTRLQSGDHHQMVEDSMATLSTAENLAAILIYSVSAFFVGKEVTRWILLLGSLVPVIVFFSTTTLTRVWIGTTPR